MRAEAEQNIDGINVTSVSPPKTKAREPERLEMIAKPEGPLVSASVTDRGERRDRREGRRPPRGERPPRRDRPARPGEREAQGAPSRRSGPSPAAAREERPPR